MAIPDHPWTKATKDAAAVRIAMTVAERGEHEGELREVTTEIGLATDEPRVELARTQARINADLSTGADVGSVVPLKANEGLASPGVKLHGAGFIVSPSQARDLGLGTREGLEQHIRPYVNGRDLLQRSRGAMVIDLFGLDEKEVRQRFPEVYQHLLLTVKAERDTQAKISPTNDAKSYAGNWWQFGKPRPALREALRGLPRYIATVETSKHRIFQFVDGAVLPDNKLTILASDQAAHLGVLQSMVHLQWTYANCGLLGVASFEQGHVYVKSKTYDPFPFPDPTPEQRARIAGLAEELDATRKAALAETDKLTMTELYNLREWVRANSSPSSLGEGDHAKHGGGAPPSGSASLPPPRGKLGEEMQRRATKARAAIVNRLHEQLDQAVADAYGWGEEWRAGTLGPSEIVARLVALNHERAAEEKAGKVRWLRPDYQVPRFGTKPNRP